MRVVIPGFSASTKAHHEAHLPTIQNAAQAHARLSRAHENQSRTRRHQRAQGEGKGTTRSLSGCGVTSRKVSRAAAVMRQASEFEAVQRSGSRIASPNFVLRAAPNDESHARLGIIAGKKTAARAVDRNRARRLIREAFRATSKQIGAYDVTIQLRNDLRGELNPSVREELRSLLDTLVRRVSDYAPRSDRQ